MRHTINFKYTEKLITPLKRKNAINYNRNWQNQSK